ncbi:cyd operon YbgE family protein [Dongshaea marina]|uniref:cyd operon YbgE family protein n=1 Tax=Dongshaea marina TaxID=2047966 RepID=UPI000D3EDFED|nr:cyd operon YbgE family protein [Dongshaea marina]
MAKSNPAAEQLLRIHSMLRRPAWRWGLLVVAVVVAIAVLQSPDRVAANTSDFSHWAALLIIWGVCCGVINGLGFRFRKIWWAVIFSPLLGWLLLIFGFIATHGYYFS